MLLAISDFLHSKEFEIVIVHSKTERERTRKQNNSHEWTMSFVHFSSFERCISLFYSSFSITIATTVITQMTTEDAHFQSFCVLLSIYFWQRWQRDIDDKICRFKQQSFFIQSYRILFCCAEYDVINSSTYYVFVFVCFVKCRFVSKCPIEIVKGFRSHYDFMLIIFPV